jgi:hypothetical protein
MDATVARQASQLAAIRRKMEERADVERLLQSGVMWILETKNVERYR